MPYPSPFGPKVVNNILMGSMKNAPKTSVFYEGDNLPKPSAFGCHRSWFSPEEKFNYRYTTTYLYFPESFIRSENNKYKYVIAKALSPLGPDENTMGMWNCIVPNVKNIETMVLSFLKMYAEHNRPDVEMTFISKSWVMGDE